MTDTKSHDIAEIETLLANRQRLVEWLARLDAAGSRTPEAVRAKVRTDYQGRLGQVVAQLSTHRDVIADTLSGLRDQVSQIQSLRQEEMNIRSEAELRHAVGEYTDDEWQLVELESSGKIAGFDHEIDKLSQETHRLEEVFSLMVPERSQSNGPKPEEPPPAAASASSTDAQPPHLSLETGPTIEIEEEQPSAPSPRPEAPRFVPRTGHFPKEPLYPRGGQTPRGSSAPTPNPAPAPAAPAPAQSTGTTTTTASSNREDELAFLRSMNVELMNAAPRGPQAPNGAAAETERPVMPVPKTLKCRDCGSLNRPTDWYCERCGAELAAV